MTPSGLPTSLQACARGIYTLEAAAGLLIEHATWLGRGDFTRFIHVGRSGAVTMAAVDWPAVADALSAGSLPCSGGERRMLELAASLAGHKQVILGDAVTGLDDRSTRMLLKAVLHASGQRQFP